MPPEDATREGKESLPRTPSVGHSAPVQECLEALAKALELEIGQRLARALDFDRAYKELLAGAVLLTRSRAARMLSMSPASLDRKVKSGQIEATYPDSHPRFELAEIKRFIMARRGKQRRGKRGAV
jgi:hypothetical protein